MNIDLVINTLKTKGSVIAIKTDTVYGLICNAFDKQAIDKIYFIKKRESKKPLSIFIKSYDEIHKYVSEEYISKSVKELMKKFWPGALTIIFKKKDNTFDYLTKNVTGIGIRIPKNEMILKILSLIDFPLAQTSCNISGEAEYRNVDEIKNKIGKDIDLIIDCGENTNNLSSTIISTENGKIEIIRQGALKIDVSNIK